MLYEQMFGFAQEAAARQQANGGFSPYDTICVICSGMGRFYTGISSTEMMNGSMMSIHAEINAVRAMQASGENAVASLALFSAVNLGAMLPCGGCAQYILSQNPANSACQIVLPDRTMSLMEVAGGAPGAAPGMAPNAGPGMMANAAPGMAPGMVPQAAPAPAPAEEESAPAEMAATAKNSKSDLLKNRVGSLLDIDDDDDDEEEEEEKKGFFGKLFGGKK